MQSNLSKLLESTAITVLSYKTYNFEERHVVAGKLRRTRHVMAGKETGRDMPHCGKKTTFAHKPWSTNEH